MKKQWMLAALLALLLAVPARATTVNELPEEKTQPAQMDVWDETWDDVAADENMSPEEAMGALYEPESEWTPPYRGEKGWGDVEDLDKYWAAYGYPDFVSYAFEAGGELLDDGTIETWWEVGLVGNDVEAQEKVLALAAPTCRVRFFNCLHSYAQREELFDEIRALEDPRINRVVMGQNTELILVWTSEADRADVQSELDAAYGPMVEVCDAMIVNDATDSIASTTPQSGAWTEGIDAGYAPPTEIGGGGMSAGTSNARRASPLPWVLAVTAVLLGVGGTVLLRRRPAAVTNTGHTVTAAPLSKAAVIRAVRESTQTPGGHVLDSLEKQLKK